jgi:hypothetical protein
VRTAHKPLSKSTNPTLFAELPPFTGSIKARKTSLLMSRLKQSKDFSCTFHNLSSEMIPKANYFLNKKQKSRQKVQKRLKKSLRFVNKKQKLEGIVGKGLNRESFLEFDPQVKVAFF